MNIGLIGLPKSGKTTIFNALTGETAEVSAYQSGKVEPNRAIVRVDDIRVEKLSDIYNPKKMVYAQLDLVDFAGLSSGAEGGEIFSGEALAAVKSCDAFALVLRNFKSEEVESQQGESNPVEELSSLLDEFLLADQILVERRLERVREDIGKGKKEAGLPAEEKLLSMVHERLEAGVTVGNIEFNVDQQKQLSGYSFLTAKPCFALLNSDEDGYGESSDIMTALDESCPVVEFAGKF